MPRLLLLQVFAGQLLLSGALGLLHVFLQFFQQVLADKLLFLCVSAQLLVFIHGNPVGEKVLCRQILESPAAEAALDNIFPNGFFRTDNKAAFGEFLLRRGAGGRPRQLPAWALQCSPVRKQLFHVHCRQLVIGLNKPGFKNGKLFDDERGGCSGYLSITSFSNSASLIMYSPPSRLPSNVIDFYPLV